MKIAYLLGSLNRGGTETMMLDCFRQAKDVGLDIIGIYRKGGLLLHDFRDTGIELFLLKPKHILDVLYFFKLRKLFKSKNIDLVHAQQPLDAFYVCIACLGTGIKIVLTFHGYNSNDGLVADKLINFIIKRTDLNIFVSKAQRAYYQKKYSLKLYGNQQVVYNGICFDKFDDVHKNSIMDELNILESCLLLGSVGNFIAGRDQLTICRFLNLLNKEGVDFAFVFAGAKSNKEPSLYDNCVKYCNYNDLDGKVFFLGSRSDVPSILNQLDAFVYATNHDTFGIGIVEAIAVGIPVFVNDWEVINEITENGQYGVLYKTKNEHDLLSKFTQFLKNKETFIKKAKEDATWARQKYDIITYLKELKNIYTDILSE